MRKLIHRPRPSLKLLDSFAGFEDTRRTMPAAWKTTLSTFLTPLIVGMLCLVCLLPEPQTSSGQAAAGLRIAVNSTTIESFPVFAAADSLSGIQLVASPNGRSAMAQLVDGSVDVATGSETQALLNSVSEPKIRIVLTLAECRYRIIGRKSAGIRRIADLRGKTVAITTNTSSHYYLIRMLRAAGLKEADVKLTVLEGPDMPNALQKGNVDAVSIWEPHAQNSLDALGNDAIVLQDPSAYTERFNLNTRTDVLADPAKRRLLDALVLEIARASTRIQTRPPNLISSLSSKIGLPPTTVMAVWPQFSFPASLSSALRASLNDVEPWVAATQKRQARTGRDLDTLIDDSLVRKAVK